MAFQTLSLEATKFEKYMLFNPEMMEERKKVATKENMVKHNRESVIHAEKSTSTVIAWRVDLCPLLSETRMWQLAMATFEHNSPQQYALPHTVTSGGVT